MVAPAIGIDLGTTYSAVAYIDAKGDVAVIHNNAGNDLTPSVVHFAAEMVVVGEEAVKKRRDGDRKTIYNIKRIIGRRHDDPVIQERAYPFEILRGERNRAEVRVESNVYTPEYISATIVKYLKSVASMYIGVEPIDAVITVPAKFSQAQREATKCAGELAGLNVLQIVNEPTAAAIAFSHMNEEVRNGRRVLVYDLGGGTFDVSIVEYEGMSTKVLATDGLTSLGGADFDKRIYEEAISRFNDLGHNTISSLDWTLMELCEQAKRALASKESSRITHPRIAGSSFVLTRATFNELCSDLFEETITLTDKMMTDAGIDEDSIDEILLVGGSTRIRRVRELLEERFPSKKMRDDISPDLAVVQGAALLAASLAQSTGRPSSSPRRSSQLSQVTLLDVTPISLGMVLDGDWTKPLIRKNTRLPFSSYQFCSNSRDMEKILFIEIVEGEQAKASANQTLAKIEMNVEPKPKGKNLIKVLLSMDVSGILSVSATDMHTKEKVSLTIKNESLDEAERQRMAEELSTTLQGG